MSKKIFHAFTKWHFEKYLNRMNGNYVMEIKCMYKTKMLF